MTNVEMRPSCRANVPAKRWRRLAIEPFQRRPRRIPRHERLPAPRLPSRDRYLIGREQDAAVSRIAVRCLPAGFTGCLQMGSGLRSGPWREIALTFGRLRRSGVSCRGCGFLLRPVELGLGRRLRRRLVGLRPRPDHRSIDEFVSIGMHPDAVGQRPAGHQWGRRNYLRGRAGFRVMRFFLWRLRLHSDHRGNAGKGDNEENFSNHIGLVISAFCPGENRRGGGRIMRPANQLAGTYPSVCGRRQTEALLFW